MSDNQQSKHLIEKLARVDSRLEEMCNLLAGQGPQPREKQAGREDPQADHPGDDGFEEGALLRAYEQNPLASRTSVTASEAESIFQRVEKINRDNEVLEKVERLERQNRKITILGSMFMTFTLLALTVLAAIMVQADLLNPGAILKGFNRGESPASAAPKATAHEEAPPTPQTVAKAADPQPAPVQEVPPALYVGSVTSNKYHLPNCKWAAQIRPDKVVTFSSATEARKRGYTPCPTCGPPDSDP